MPIRLPLALLIAVLAGSAVAAPSGDGAPRKGGPAHARARIVVVDEVRGEQGTAASRAALREAIGRHLRRRGFDVLETGRGFTYRLQPKLLLLESQGGANVEVKASVVALDRKGQVAAMVEGGARARGGASGAPAASLESQALEAAARSLAEDLGRRLLEAR